jgi:hypothetical protein
MAKKARAEENKYEKFSVERISRAEIKGADYNPRKIGEEARRKLKKSLKEHGLVMPIVVNRRTMTIVSGHQRVSLLDDIIRKNDYPLTCAFVDVDEKEEAVLNVSLNNQSLMGEWDAFALQDLHDIFPDIDFESDFGFDASEIDIILGDFAKEFEETPLIDPVKEAKKLDAGDFREMKKAQRDKARDENGEGKSYRLDDSDYVLQIVFPNNREKADFMRKIRKDPKEKYVKSGVIFDIARGKYDLSALNK